MTVLTLCEVLAHIDFKVVKKTAQCVYMEARTPRGRALARRALMRKCPTLFTKESLREAGLPGPRPPRFSRTRKEIIHGEG